ncbi:UDP-2,3-diacylglucosamine diphosphatase LpxI [Desulfovibrio sp. OttesenSCG-928-O18]|nr:UDP-2,3-diacylglucosamine diphosphatase LpxI [Desulfovibrio sp. OttesenSCG-928-O18]
MGVLGIIAGKGQFPVLVARGARDMGLSVVMVGFSGHTDPAIASEADAFVMLHLGQVSKLIEFMHRHGVTELCFAGAISKPKALDIRPDMRAMKLIFSLRGKGDDALLRTVADELASEGLAVISPAKFAPSLLAPAGVQTKRGPSPEEWDDIRVALPVAQAMGRLDIGQLVVVRSGIVAAVEALEGTDAALERGGTLGGPGCTALKIFKPGQDNRMDQPAIGPKTLRVMAKHKYACLAYQARDALFFDLEEAVRIADAANIAVIGITPEEMV